MSKPEQVDTSDDKTLSPEWVRELYAANQKTLKEVLEKHSQLYKGNNIDPFNMAAAYMDAMFSLWRDPVGLLEAQKNFFNDSIKLWQYTSARVLGKAADPVIMPKTEDRRWRDAEWSNNPVYEYLKQSYLLAARCLISMILPRHIKCSKARPPVTGRLVFSAFS